MDSSKQAILEMLAVDHWQDEDAVSPAIPSL